MKKNLRKQLEDLPELRFKPAMDWWVLLSALVFIVGLFGMILVLLWYSSSSGLGKAVSTILLLGTIIYLIDVFFYSSYILTDRELVISSNLRHVKVPYRTMRELRAGGMRSLISFAKHKRYALSRRNIVLRLNHDHWKSISVSPRQKDAFITALLQRIDLERAQRAVRVHSKK